MNKMKWMHLAEVIDAYRLVPRLFMLGYGFLVWDTHMWYTALEAPTTQQVSYADAIYVGAAMLTGWYYQTGRKWEKKDG